MTATAEELFQALVPSLAEDVLLALRAAYYVGGRSLVPDNRYDEAEKEFLERPETDPFDSPLNKPGSDNIKDYPERVRALTLYLGLTAMKRRENYA